MKRQRKMPTESVIRKHWVSRLWECKGYDSPHEFLEPGTCFACGRASPVERAHILAVCDGGSDSPDNLHMLCAVCHKDSEHLTGDRYDEWLKTRTVMDAVCSGAARGGFNVWSDLVMERA